MIFEQVLIKSIFTTSDDSDPTSETPHEICTAIQMNQYKRLSTKIGNTTQQAVYARPQQQNELVVSDKFPVDDAIYKTNWICTLTGCKLTRNEPLSVHHQAESVYDESDEYDDESVQHENRDNESVADENDVDNHEPPEHPDFGPSTRNEVDTEDSW
jgi:hypothetical protein